MDNSSGGADAADGDSDSPRRTPQVADYFRIFSYATRWDLCTYAVAVLASLGAGVTMPLMNIIFALYIMAIFFVRWALSSINKFCFRMIGIRLSSAIRREYLEALYAQLIQAIDAMPQGAPATAISTTSNTLQLGISERLGSFLQSLVTIFGSLIIAFIWSWDLTLVTCSLVIYVVAVISFVMPRIVHGQAAMAQADGEGNSIASEALANVRLVMVFSAQNRVLSSYTEWVDKSRKKGHRVAPLIGIQAGLIYFGMFGAFGLAFWYGTQRYSVGAITRQDAIDVGKPGHGCREFFSVIDAPLPKAGSLRPDISSDDILSDNVTFEYPTRRGANILNGLTLRIRNGKKTALVGPSGSGKSTIVSSIEQRYPLEDRNETGDDTNDHERKTPGSITVGSHNLSDLDPKRWRTQIGLVQQEPFLFNDTIYGNVVNGLIGSPLDKESQERKVELVMQACEEAYASEFIDCLPEGYNTIVGDGGVKLSGAHRLYTLIMSDIGSEPYLKAIHLRLQLLAVQLFENPPLMLDVESVRAQTPKYHEFLSLAGAAVQAAQRGTTSPAHRISLQCPLVWNLFVVTLFCHDPLAHDQAAGMLRDYPGQDELWNAWSLFVLARRNREVERTNMLEGVPAEQWQRLLRRKVIFEDDGDRVVFR
ncbi:hypothetical protein LQW54_006238 [Pestalotiopsis sp. IQ-011]